MATDDKTGSDAAQGQADESGSKSALSDLINEYESQKDSGKQVLDALKAVEPAVKYVEKREALDNKERLDGMINTAIDKVLESDDLKDFKDRIPRRLVHGFLGARTESDKEFSDVMRRHYAEGDETAFNAQIEKARTDFVTDLKGLVGKSDRDDIEAAKAAVSGQTSTPPPEKSDLPAPEDMFEMSGQEFNKLLKTEIRKAAQKQG